MSTRQEDVIDALKEWRKAERQLRRDAEDGREDWESRDQQERCATLFIRAVQAAQTTMEVVSR